jgi:outer membrane protein assembly factor BamB
MIEARRLSDGESLWERPADVDQRLVTADDGVVVLMHNARIGDRISATLTVLDAATGSVLWSRPQVSVPGTAAGVVIVEELDEPEAAVIQDPDADVPVLRSRQRFLGLANRTGAAAWTITVAEGAAVSHHRDPASPGRLAHLDVMDGTGRLNRWDTATGTVTETRRLSWSGPVAGFYAGWIDRTGRPADQVVLYPAGQPDAVVLDAQTGRSLFRWPVEIGSGLYQCTETVFCTSSDEGLQAVDSLTGERRWRLTGSDTVIAFAGERLLVGTFFEESPAESEDIRLVDSRTGTVVEDFPGWHVLHGAGERLLLWRAADDDTALIGELDPQTGLITVHTNATDWTGSPECSVDGTMLACVAVGGRLTVWRLPNRP